MLNKIDAKHSNAQIDIYAHPLVSIDRIRLDEFHLLNPRITIIENIFTKKITWYERAIVSTFLRRKQQHSLIKSFTKDAANALAHFTHYDSVFIAGGDQWSGRELGVSMFGTLSAIRQINPNIHIFPFSLKSSIVKLYSKSVLKDFFSLLEQPLIARDSLTKDILDQLEIPAELGVDCAFSLQDRAPSIDPAKNRDSSRILFAIKGPKDVMSATLASLIKQGANIELISTCPAEDNSTFQSLSDKFTIPFRQPTSWQEIVSEFKASSLVVTNRLHGLILSTLAEAPLLPVTTRKKSLAFVHDANMPYFANNIPSVTLELIEKTKSSADLVVQRASAYRDSSNSIIHSPV